MAWQKLSSCVSPSSRSYPHMWYKCQPMKINKVPPQSGGLGSPGLAIHCEDCSILLPVSTVRTRQHQHFFNVECGWRAIGAWSAGADVQGVWCLDLFLWCFFALDKVLKLHRYPKPQAQQIKRKCKVICEKDANPMGSQFCTVLTACMQVPPKRGLFSSPRVCGTKEIS